MSRRAAESEIAAGKVTVNGAVASVGDKVDPAADVVIWNGKTLKYPAGEHVYIMLHKPRGYLTSMSDDRGRKCVSELVRGVGSRVYPIGRLDLNSEGLLLMTDDGELAHNILSPSHHIDKTYIAELDKPFDDSVVQDFENGMSLNGERLMSAEITPLNEEKTVAQVVLRQGLYHQVKRMFKKHGITVVELKRTKMGGLCLDLSLGEGECRYLTNDEIEMLFCVG